MIIESLVGGTVVLLAAVGTGCLYRRIRTKLSYWLASPHEKLPLPQTSLTDPTPSFTVELVRTVLEHQARREDESRQQLAILLMQVAGSRPRGEGQRIHLLETERTPVPNHDGTVANTECGVVARTIRRLLPARRR